MEDMRAHRSHAGTAADEHLLVRSILNEKFAVRTRDSHLVARLAREDIGRADARIEFHESSCRTVPRRRGYTDVEHDDVAFGRMIGHRVGPERRLGILRNQIPHFHMVPVLAVFRLDVEVAEADLVVFRNVDLNVASRAELQMLAFGQLDDEFLDKGRHIAVRNHLALPFPDAEDGFGNLDLHILLYLDLTAQTPFLGLLPTREEVDLGGAECRRPPSST